MLNFFEFYNKLNEVGGGKLADLLKQAGIGVEKPATEPEKPIAAGKSPLDVTPLPAEKPTPTRPRFDPVATPEERPAAPRPASGGDSGTFLHRSIPGSPEQTVISKEPPVGPAREPLSRLLGAAHTRAYGGDSPRDKTPALHIDPSIIDYRKQYPDLAAAFMAINSAYAGKKPFTMNQIDPAAGLDNIMAALQIMKDDHKIDLVDAEGNPMKMSRATLGQTRFVPADTPYRGSKGELPTASPEAQRAADDEMLISPRYDSLKRRVSAQRPQVGPGPAAPKPTSKELGSREMLQAKMNTVMGFLDALAKRASEPKPAHQEAVDRLWVQLDDMSKSADPEEKRAGVAWKAELERAIPKAGLRSPNESVDWYDYFNLMESYRPSAVR